MGRGTSIFFAWLVTAAAVVAALAIPARASTPGIVLGWNYGSQTSTYLVQDASAPGLNTVSPSWWMLRSNGTVADTGNRGYTTWAHTHGKRVWPMFTNDLDQASSHRAMTDPVLRAKVIASVRDLARHYSVDGVNIDWENLATADRDAFSAFVREAATTWRASGLVVSVDVSARTDTWQLGNWSESFDQRALGAAADIVVLMAYDEHNRLRPIGPTASLPWVEESVKYLLRTTPASKVVLGVPFYTNDWNDKTAKGTTVTIAQTPAHARAHHATVRWDARAGSELATYTEGGVSHHMWMESARSLGLKAALVRKYGLAGVAAWRIGFETPDAWRAIGPVSVAPAVVTAPPPTKAVVTAAPTTPPTATPARTKPVAIASLPPVRPVSRRSSWIVAALLAFVVSGGAAFATRRSQRRV